MKMRVVVGLATGFLVAAVAANAAGRETEVTIPARLFAPGELDVLAGDTVMWRNADAKSHTATSDTDLFDSGHLAPGSTFSTTFRGTGVFPYHCSIHRSMRGVVRVYTLILAGQRHPLPPAWAVRLHGISPAPGETVVLERVGRGAPTLLAQATADLEGSFSFVVRPTEPAAYRARAGDARSPVLRVAVKPNVAVTVRGSGLLVSTTPKRTGSTVALQVYDRDRFDWVTLAKERLDGASRATFTLPDVPLRARAVVRGRNGWGDGFSRTLVLRAR